jgi:hypothetical protein
VALRGKGVLADLHGTGCRRDACQHILEEGTKMTRLIAAALVFVAATAAPVLACEWSNKSAATGSQSTVASQAQQSKPLHQHNRS